jgi:hypothetical protein
MNVSRDWKGPYSQYRTVRVKDIVNNKHVISLFGNLREMVEPNKVYRFTGMLVQNEWREGDKFGRMRNQSRSKITLASDTMQNRF